MKNLATKEQVENEFDLGDKNVEKIFKNSNVFFISCFVGNCYFDDDRSQNYLVCQPVFSGNMDQIFGRKSKELSEESIRPCATADNILKLMHSKIAVKFEGKWFKQDKLPFTDGNAVNIFIVYELDIWSRELRTDFTLKDCLFWGVKLTKNDDPYKYCYSGYGIGFSF